MYPIDEQWALFDRYKNCPPPLSPQTSLQQWELDYPDVARLVGVSRHTVAHWFSTGAGSRLAPEHHCRRLATIDFLWRNAERLPYELLDEWCDLPDEQAISVEDAEDDLTIAAADAEDAEPPQ
ncbi:hypothetical protein ACQ4M3_38850 [Leptolyngbya sp. AN03gr2]|uniref:hypothetical protein n=1 Tax=unclassified Leptolyngbya TaxID=2650499 RepID=UPI003D3201D5